MGRAEPGGVRASSQRILITGAATVRIIGLPRGQRPRRVIADGSDYRAALIGAFTPTGTVDDFGRTFTGPGEIGAWSDRENIGTHNRITVQRVTETDELILAAITVTGAGYNGGGVFAFQLDGNLIQGLTIRG